MFFLLHVSVKMDFDTFGLQLETVAKKINMQMKTIGEVTYYEFSVEDYASDGNGNTKVSWVSG